MIPGEPVRWERGESRSLVTTRVLEVRSVHFHHPVREVDRDFVVVHAPDWVNILALTPEGRVVLVNQFRYGSNAFSLEVPGGAVEAGENLAAAGLRELSEETGYGGGRSRLLGSVHPNPAIQDNRCHYVLVEGAVPTNPVKWDNDEEIQVSTASISEALAWARSGRITHSLTVAALLFLEGVRPV